MATYSNNPLYLGGMQTTDDLSDGQPQQQGVDALKALLGMRPSSDTTGQTFDPVKLASLRAQREGELKDRLFASQMADQWPNPRQNSGAEQLGLSNQIKDLQGDQAMDPYTGQEAQANQRATEAAVNAGFPGGSLDAQGRPQNPLQEQANAARYAAMQQLILPKQIEGQNAIALEQAKGEEARKNFAQMIGGTGQPSNAPASGSPGYNDFKETPTAGGLFSWATGIGAPPASSMLDQAGAYKDYQQYMKGGGGPLTPVIENSSLGNLQAIKANFPSIRGIAQLLPLFEQHQPQPGREVPALTDQKLSWMIDNMQKMVQDNDPSNPDLQRELRTVSMSGGTPSVSMKATPASLIQGQEALKTTLRQYQTAQAALRARYPSLAPQDQGSVKPGRKVVSVEQVQ